MAMFESLSKRLEGVFTNLSGKGKLTEADVNEAMREVRMAMLEADVSYKVVRQFVDRVKESGIFRICCVTLQCQSSYIGAYD